MQTRLRGNARASGQRAETFQCQHNGAHQCPRETENEIENCRRPGAGRTAAAATLASLNRVDRGPGPSVESRRDRLRATHPIAASRSAVRPTDRSRRLAPPRSRVERLQLLAAGTVAGIPARRFANVALLRLGIAPAGSPGPRVHAVGDPFHQYRAGHEGLGTAQGNPDVGREAGEPFARVPAGSRASGLSFDDPAGAGPRAMEDAFGKRFQEPQAVPFASVRRGIPGRQAGHRARSNGAVASALFAVRFPYRLPS